MSGMLDVVWVVMVVFGWLMVVGALATKAGRRGVRRAFRRRTFFGAMIAGTAAAAFALAMHITYAEVRHVETVAFLVCVALIVVTLAIRVDRRRLVRYLRSVTARLSSPVDVFWRGFRAGRNQGEDFSSGETFEDALLNEHYDQGVNEGIAAKRTAPSTDKPSAN